MTADATLFDLDIPARRRSEPLDAAERARKDAEHRAFRRRWYPDATDADWQAWHAGTGPKPVFVPLPKPERKVWTDGVLVEHFPTHTKISTTLYGVTTVQIHLLTSESEPAQAGEGLKAA